MDKVPVVPWMVAADSCGARTAVTCERVRVGPNRGRVHLAGNGRGNCWGGQGYDGRDSGRIGLYRMLKGHVRTVFERVVRAFMCGPINWQNPWERVHEITALG